MRKRLTAPDRWHPIFPAHHRQGMAIAVHRTLTEPSLRNLAPCVAGKTHSTATDEQRVKVQLKGGRRVVGSLAVQRSSQHWRPQRGGIEGSGHMASLGCDQQLRRLTPSAQRPFPDPARQPPCLQTVSDLLQDRAEFLTLTIGCTAAGTSHRAERHQRKPQRAKTKKPEQVRALNGSSGWAQNLYDPLSKNWRPSGSAYRASKPRMLPVPSKF